jgi:hypothetical protein
LYAELNHAFSDDWLDKVSFDIKDLFVVCVNKRVVVSCYDILTRKITQWGTCFTYNNYEKVETEGRVNGSMTGSATALTFYINIQQSEYVFNTNIAAGVKVYTVIRKGMIQFSIQWVRIVQWRHDDAESAAMK